MKARCKTERIKEMLTDLLKSYHEKIDKAYLKSDEQLKEVLIF